MGISIKRVTQRPERTRYGSFPLILVATSDDELARTHARKMFCSLKAKTCIGSDDGDCLSRQVSGFDWRNCGPLVIDETEDRSLHRFARLARQSLGAYFKEDNEELP